MPYWDVDLHKFTDSGAARRVMASNIIKIYNIMILYNLITIIKKYK